MVDELHGDAGAKVPIDAGGSTEPSGFGGSASFEPGSGGTEDAGGPNPEAEAGPSGGPPAPEQPSFAERVAAMRGEDGDDHYEPNALTLLGDVLQQPVKAFSYLGSHRAEHLGLGIVVYVLAQLPLYLTGTFVEIETNFGGLLRRTVTTVLSFVIGAFVFHLIARMLGGHNRFSKLLQALAISSLPGLLAAPVFLIMPAWGGSVSAVMGIWSFVLSIIAVREVYRFSTGRAVATVLMPALFVVGLVLLLLVIAGLVGGSAWLDFIELF